MNLLVLVLYLISFKVTLAEQGVITNVSQNKLTYYTPTKSYEVEIDKLNKSEQEQVRLYLEGVDLIDDRVPYRQRQRFDLNITEKFNLIKVDENGLRPDCNEQPVTPAEIFELANSAPKGGMVHFLQSIPEGSMQIFTFMKETQSRQHHGVSPMNPRILRSNADGSLTISFVCDPSSQDYGKVEVMHFDRDEGRFKMATLDFTNDQDKEIDSFDRQRFSHLKNTPDSYMNHNRVNHNPKSCLKCHSSDPNALDPDPRALWDQYNEWPGAYGRKDDRMDKYSDKQDRTELFALKENMKDNPCFQTLPMPELPEPIIGEFGVKEYQPEWVYPYSEWPGLDYDTRPNLRFTDNLARFGAQRLTRKFLEAPGFNRIRFEVAMATFNCPQIEDYNTVFKKANPNYQAPPLETASLVESIRRTHGAFSPEQERGKFRDFRELFQLGKSYGFKNSDWTLFFNDEERNSYQAPNSVDIQSDGFGDLVQGELLKKLTQENPSLNGIVNGVNDIEEVFGVKNACIEEITTPVQSHEEEDEKNIAKLCEELDKLRKESPKPLHQLASPNRDELLNSTVRNCLEEKYGPINLKFEESFIRDLTRENLDEFKYDLGRSIAGTCFHCHSKGNDVLPDSVAFFDSEEATKEELRKGPEFINTVRTYINSGRMPKGIPLDQEQRDAFLYYMENQYVNALTSP